MGKREFKNKIEYVDDIINCLCGAQIFRRDKKNPEVYRFKFKDYTLEVISPKHFNVSCRRCGRWLSFPYSEQDAKKFIRLRPNINKPELQSNGGP